MLFKQRFLDGISSGAITIAFRRWQRPSVKAGGTLQTPAGLLAITSVDVIEESAVTPAAARRAGFTSREEALGSLGDREGTLYRIGFERVGSDPRIELRRQDQQTEPDVEALRTKLGRLDSRSAHGPWTRRILNLIAEHPQLRAADLAARCGHEMDWLKLNIRKLKNLGLTESLKVGYRLSPRGREFLERDAEAGDS